MIPAMWKVFSDTDEAGTGAEELEVSILFEANKWSSVDVCVLYASSRLWGMINAFDIELWIRMIQTERGRYMKVVSPDTDVV